MRRVQLLAIAMVVLALAVSVGGRRNAVSRQESTETIPGDPVTDFDGNAYRTVTIGDQVWMAENLRSTHYRDGSPIAYYEYDRNPDNARTYGRLYSSSAVMRGEASSNGVPSGVRGIAPRGWHVPSRAEWEKLAGSLGGAGIAGGKLKEKGTGHWLAPNAGATDESRFTALPAGMHDFTGIFQWIGDRAVFATSTANTGQNGVAAIVLFSLGTTLEIGNFHPDDAYSVRCVKDH